jgi:acyl carrier protein
MSIAANAKPPSGGADVAARLLEILRDLAVELRPERAASLRVTLDSELDRDLGLDSLARAELLLRLERAFDIALPQDLLTQAETARELLDAVVAATPGEAAPLRAVVELELGPPAAWPDRAQTLTEMLDWHVARQGDRPHVILTDGRSDDPPISYGDLAADARHIAAVLRQWGLAPGERAAIMLPTGADFFAVFFAILYAGAVPVPIYPPFRPAQMEDHLRRQAATLDNAGAAILITVPEARAVGALMRSLAPSLRAVRTPADLRVEEPADTALPTPAADDLAFLQYTSGSTGAPKGVMLSHANLLANIRAMGEAIGVRDDDVFVSWLPLYHDMGLIGAWLGSLYFAVPAVIMSPLTFLARPANWLWAIHRHRGTLSAAPNFAFELCLKRIEDADVEGLDLSSLRMVANGAEPVSPTTIRAFADRFAAHGFAPTAMAPVYGLAECAVGLAFPTIGTPPWIDRIDRAALARDGTAEPAPDGAAAAVQEFVACGHALPGHEMRVVDAAGRELGDRREGRLEFRGPSATRGYFNNPEKTAELFDGDWRDSGDLAYLDHGTLFLTGRIKDIIIRAGRNIYPQEVEDVVGAVDGVRRGCVAVFGSPDPKTGTDRIVVLAETRVESAAGRDALVREIDAAAGDILGGPADDVVLAPPHTVLKTSSGKIRRAACRDIYESGEVGRPPRAVWWQILRLALRGVGPAVRRWLRLSWDRVYAGWWWTAMGGLVGIVWALLMVVPGLGLRWRIMGVGARLALAATATPLTVRGLEHLRPGGAILAVNHASYVDGLVLAAVLPGPLVFTAKGELATHRFAGPALRRMGARFLERFAAEQSVEDVAHLDADLRAGARLVFFPEGTLTRMPGILAFRMGAFHLAAHSGVPIYPVTIRGTRSLLRGDQWFPRRSAVSVDIGAPLTATGAGWSPAVALRDQVRAQILTQSGEPDLGDVRAADVLRPASQSGPDAS